MKDEKTKIMTAIFEHCKTKLQMEFNSVGYVEKTEDNLITQFLNWTEIQNELNQGQGNELKPNKDGLIKFNAVHSSSSLCVNNFAPFKECLNKFELLGFNNFSELSFEKKLSTGISVPHLDVYLESESNIIGIESKFTEHLTPKPPNHNLAKYLDRKELNYLPEKYNDLIKYYVDCKENMYLDVAQLIKHGIGLIRESKRNGQSQPVLVYLYWEPKNWDDFEIFEKHLAEIEEFKSRIEQFIQFIPISYIEFWSLYENDITFSNHIRKVKERYSIDV